MSIIIGIDVAKDKLDIYRSDKQFTTIINDEKHILNYCKQYSDASTVKIVVEATGKYHRLLVRLLSSHGFPVMIVNPYQSRNFARAMHLLCKTDKVDAKLLCIYGSKMDFKQSYIRSNDQEELDELSRRKEQLQSDLVREKNRVNGSRGSIAGSIKAHIKFLEESIKDIDEELESKVTEDKELNDKLEILTSVPGVGKVTAISLLSYMPELGKLGRNQICALSGLAPINCDSGTMKGRRSIQRGRLIIRQALYMPILNAIRNNPIIKVFYNRLKDAGKNGKVALTACMRKMIAILNLMIKNNTKWHFTA
jgi:transposase